MLKNSRANATDAKRLGQSSTSTNDEKQEPEQVFSQTEQQKKLHYNYASAMVTAYSVMHVTLGFSQGGCPTT